MGQGDRGLPLGRLPGVPAEQLHVVGVAARAAHQQAEGLVFPGHVAAGRRLDQGQARRARLQVGQLFDREAAGVGPSAGQALPEGLEPAEDDGHRLEATGHHRLEGAGDRRDVLLGCHLGLVDRDQQPGAVTGGEAPDVPQCVLEGSGGAPGADVMASLDGRAARGHAEVHAGVELRLEVLRTPAKTPPGPDGLGYALEQDGDQALFLQRLHVQHRPAQLLRCDLADHVQQDRLAGTPAAEDRPAEAGVLGADLQHPLHVVYQAIAACDYRRAASETGGVGRSRHLVSHR